MPFLMRDSEQDFLISHLTPETRVLEVGSGGSTIEFAKRVKSVVSLEHNSRWYRKCKRELSKFPNVEYVYRKPTKPWRRYKTDGSYESFKDYIDYLVSLKDREFDLILIDGRARADCMLHIGKYHPNADFFLHDFYNDPELLKKNPSRKSYLKVLDHFELVHLEQTLAKFKFRGEK